MRPRKQESFPLENENDPGATLLGKEGEEFTMKMSTIVDAVNIKYDDDNHFLTIDPLRHLSATPP